MGKTLCILALIVANPSTDHCQDKDAWVIWENLRTFPLPPPKFRWRVLHEKKPVHALRYFDETSDAKPGVLPPRIWCTYFDIYFYEYFL